MLKKYLLNLTIFLFILIGYNCKNENKDYAVISGKVLNAKELKFNASFGTNNKNKRILLNKDGTFLDTIYTKEGLYTFFDGINMIGFYLKPTNEYTINYDANNFRESGIILAGSDTDYNKYYTKKSQNKVFIDPTSISEEHEFRSYLNRIKEAQFNSIADSELSHKLKEDERSKVTYQYLYDLILFLHYADINNPTKTTLEELDIDYNDEEHYKKYGPYNSLIDIYYSRLMSDYELKQKKIDTSFSIHQDALRFYATEIPNEYIKNDMIANNALYHFKHAKDLKGFYNDFMSYYTGNDSVLIKDMSDLYTSLSKLESGSTSPKFFDYKNYKGGTNSLDDFLGKPIYINLWATWCGNCYGQMPALKELTKEYKEVEFLSIAWKDEENKWRKVVAEEKLVGNQLLADFSNQSFFEEYGVYGVPRYIILDKNGKVINYNAPSPSDKELKIIFNNLDRLN